MSKARVFIIESPNPLDLLEDRGERLALEQVCKLVGHDAGTFLVRDRVEFLQTCSYISSIQCHGADKTPLFLHISVHGDDTGIAAGRDDISWSELAEATLDMYGRLKYYNGPIVLILSACGANKQKLTSELTKGRKGAFAKLVPPEYVFVFSEDTILWTDAVVTWTIFYNEAVKLDFSGADKCAVQNLLTRLNNAGFGNLRYFRWDNKSEKYLVYPAK